MMLQLEYGMKGLTGAARCRVGIVASASHTSSGVETLGLGSMLTPEGGPCRTSFSAAVPHRFPSQRTVDLGNYWWWWWWSFYYHTVGYSEFFGGELEVDQRQEHGAF